MCECYVISPELYYLLMQFHSCYTPLVLVAVQRSISVWDRREEISYLLPLVLFPCFVCILKSLGNDIS